MKERVHPTWEPNRNISQIKAAFSVLPANKSHCPAEEEEEKWSDKVKSGRVERLWRRWLVVAGGLFSLFWRAAWRFLRFSDISCGGH